MVIDSSAIIAILLHEPERPIFVTAIGAEGDRRLSSATLVECSIAADSRAGETGIADLDRLIKQWEITIHPVDEQQAQLARTAHRRFGRGRHPARLNFGDCFSYALARYFDEPLLFKGSDFTHTDVRHHPASTPLNQVHDSATAHYAVESRPHDSAIAHPGISVPVPEVARSAICAPLPTRAKHMPRKRAGKVQRA